MSTIATDGKMMAGDSLITCGGIIISEDSRKVHRLNDGSIIGTVGRTSDMISVVAWMNDPQLEKPKTVDFCAIMINQDGAFWAHDDLVWTPVQLPAAAGSGSELALGAMLSGASLSEAVSIAAKRDVYTGGRIYVEALSE